MMIFIKYKDGRAEDYDIKDFDMMGSTISMVTEEDNVLYLDYFDIKDIQIINS